MLALGLPITFAVFAIAFATGLLIRRHAEKLGLVTPVNERSSHAEPTPTAGGIGIALAGSLAGFVLAAFYPFAILPVLLAGVLIAVIGYWDDRQPIPARWRLGAQIVLVGAVVSTLPLDLLAARIGLALPEPILFVGVVLAGALWVNLFNFMDGIDGLAASGAVFILLAALLLAGLGQPAIIQQRLFWWMAWLAAACLGFLLLNWAPARLFMGDTGSTYLGLMLGFFALASILAGWLTVPQWLILAAAFLADSLTTLIRRALNREPVWQAHRRHGYQLLQRRFGSHARVTLLYLGIDLVLLLPLALAAGLWPDYAWIPLLAVYVALVTAALLIGAGAPLEPQAEKERAGAHDRQ